MLRLSEKVAKKKEEDTSSDRKKKFAKALEGFSSGVGQSKKTDISEAKQGYSSAAQAALSRRRQNQRYK